MTKNEKLENLRNELARCAVQPDDTPQRKAERLIEAGRAVEAAGHRYAAPAWALVRDMQGVDIIAAFEVQVQAFRDLRPTIQPPEVAAEPEPDAADPSAPKVRPSSWRTPEVARVLRPKGL